MGTASKWRGRNYFLKRVFGKWQNWTILLLHVMVIAILFFNIEVWFFNIKKEIVVIDAPDNFETYIKIVNPIINNANNFFDCVFLNLIFITVLIWTLAISSLSYLFWEQIDDIAQNTQKDGTDLFFLSTEIPTSHKQIFCRKAVFLIGTLVSLHIIVFALLISLMLWKVNYFSNFTVLQTFLFLTFNFLITPLFLFVPLVVLLFSLASLKSVLFTILKWFGFLSAILIALLGFLFFQSLEYGGEFGKKILKRWKDFSQWLGKNYLLTTLAITRVVICLEVFALSLAYKKFQEEDLS